MNIQSVVGRLAEISKKTYFVGSFEGALYEDGSFKGNLVIGGEVIAKVSEEALAILGRLPQLKCRGSKMGPRRDALLGLLKMFFAGEISPLELYEGWTLEEPEALFPLGDAPPMEAPVEMFHRDVSEKHPGYASGMKIIAEEFPGAVLGHWTSTVEAVGADCHGRSSLMIFYPSGTPFKGVPVAKFLFEWENVMS